MKDFTSNFLSNLIAGIILLLIPIYLSKTVFLDSHGPSPQTEPENQYQTQHESRSLKRERDFSNQNKPMEGTNIESQKNVDNPFKPSIFVNATSDKKDAYVIVVDEWGVIQNNIANSIAEVYRKKGKNVGIGLFRPEFFQLSDFNALRGGDSGLFQKLNLSAFTDFIVIGEVRFTERTGNLVDGTIIITASLLIDIISVHGIEYSFNIADVNGNGVTKDQAKEAALQKILSRYFNEYSYI